MFDYDLCLLSVIFKYCDLYSKIKIISLNKYIYNNKASLYLCTTRNQTLLTMRGIQSIIGWTNNSMYKVMLFYTYIKYFQMNYHLLSKKDKKQELNMINMAYKKYIKISKKIDTYLSKYCILSFHL